jgi:chromosome segregation ATPase
MRRFLQYANLFGVAALGVLCLVQWQADRRLNLELRHLDQVRRDQSAKIQELETSVKGLNEDLAQFKASFTDEHANRVTTEQKLATSERELRLVMQERYQFKETLSNWLIAVAIRDDRLKQANDRIHDLGDKLNSSVSRYNELATNYNQAIGQIKELQNVLTKLAPTNPPPAAPVKP